MIELNDSTVSSYLRSNPRFLEQFVTSHNVTKESFQRWTLKRRMKEKQRSSSRVAATSQLAWTLPDLAPKRKIILQDGNDKKRIIYEMGVCMAEVLGMASDYEAIVETSEGAYVVSARNPKEYPARELVLRKAKRNRKAPVYSQKLMDCGGNSIGQIDFSSVIAERDKPLLNVIALWGSSCAYYGQVAAELADKGPDSDHLTRQRKLHEFLLDVAKSIFQDIVSMDNVILQVMNFAQNLVNADRASLFLVDSKSQQLYARIFDIGQHGSVKTNADGIKEIRMPIGKGIAGIVAKTGEPMNIESAYEDERFNDEVDSLTGYHTNSILCMPIVVRNGVIGVVQMVNKKQGVFNKADEDAFQMFAVYCGLALHHAKLYDKIRRSEQKYKVTLEVLAYHSVCNADEVSKLRKLEKEMPPHMIELETFDFNGMKLSEVEKPLYAVYMFRELFKGKFSFDPDELVRFVLTVRKNYRKVAYHNWAHGWSVAHAMFALLLSTDIFTPFEALSLFLSCLCHDLDHRGKNNAYMKTMSTPLAAIYSTSVMEHHHFNQTVTILQQDGHNILKALSPEEYKKSLALIKHCILATDLALFFKNKDRLKGIIEKDEFDIQSNDHRGLIQAILMTGCDLIASAKPWQIQTDTVKVIFEEFYEQGDAERFNGREPIEMMDRTRAHKLPQMQVGFMRGICVPCYDLIAKVVPEATKLRDQCEFNAKMWEQLALEQEEKMRATEAAERGEQMRENGTTVNGSS